MEVLNIVVFGGVEVYIQQQKAPQINLIRVSLTIQSLLKIDYILNIQSI